jgi:uncharacterized membrane protein YoaK (UPF0700 family)
MMDLAAEGTWWGDYVNHPRHGPLPALLLILTVSTGLIDAVSILSLGRVFVANMTGNIVFIGFALAGALGFSLAASLIALGGFLVGAGIGGIGTERFGAHRGVLLRNGAAIELVLLLAAASVVALSPTPLPNGVRDIAVALAAIALGVQNAMVRRLAVPDITTTVLTMTLTGVAADVRSRNLRVALRRVSSVTCMLLGALVGALLVIHGHIATALFLAAGLFAIVVGWVALQSKVPAEWHNEKQT